MPSIRLRKLLIDRLLSTAKSTGELGLAVLMSAGVTSCGGTTVVTGDAGSSDSGSDTSADAASEHPQFEVAEVAQEAGVHDVTTDQPQFEVAEVAQEAGFHDAPVMEAVEVAQEAG